MTTPQNTLDLRQPKPDKLAKQKRRIKLSRRQFIITGAAVLILALVGSGIGYLSLQNSVKDPFDAKTVASAGFPLYYPTSVPKGYHFNAKSVSTPQTGVILLTLIGPHDQKLYISQEIRPTTFDFGSYYKNFQDSQIKVVSNGTIAVGRINNGKTELGSLATNKSWVLTNTDASIPLGELVTMLNSLEQSR